MMFENVGGYAVYAIPSGLMQSRVPASTNDAGSLLQNIPYSSYCDTATAHNVWVCTCVAAPFLPAEGWTLGVAVAVHPPPPPKVMAQPPVGIGVGDGCGGGGGGLLAQSLGGFVP